MGREPTPAAEYARLVVTVGDVKPSQMLPAPVRARVRAELYDGSRVVLELDVIARAKGHVCVRQEREGRPPWHAWIPADRAERL